jgi:hypothetical protein
MRVHRKYPEYYDEKAKKLYDAGDDLFEFPGLIMCETREESKKINATPESPSIPSITRLENVPSITKIKNVDKANPPV